MFERDRLLRVGGGIAQRALSRLAWASGGNAAVPRRRKASKKVGAHHARPDRKRSVLRVAPLPPRKKGRGAFDSPCAPWPAGGVGTRGVPTHRRKGVEQGAGVSGREFITASQHQGLLAGNQQGKECLTNAREK